MLCNGHVNLITTVNHSFWVREASRCLEETSPGVVDDGDDGLDVGLMVVCGCCKYNISISGINVFT